jgi:hypothetical protein
VTAGPGRLLLQAQKLAEASAEATDARHDAAEASAKLPKLRQAVKHQEQVCVHGGAGGGCARVRVCMRSASYLARCRGWASRLLQAAGPPQAGAAAAKQRPPPSPAHPPR